MRTRSATWALLPRVARVRRGQGRVRVEIQRVVGDARLARPIDQQRVAEMPELVRRGHIYIAQPPLYQIKRKKREEYVDDDVQLNKILISLGAEDVRLKNLADDKEVTAAQLKDILESLEKLAKLSESVRRHGGDFDWHHLHVGGGRKARPFDDV